MTEPSPFEKPDWEKPIHQQKQLSEQRWFRFWIIFVTVLLALVIVILAAG